MYFKEFYASFTSHIQNKSTVKRSQKEILYWFIRKNSWHMRWNTILIRRPIFDVRYEWTCNASLSLTFPAPWDFFLQNKFFRLSYYKCINHDLRTVDVRECRKGPTNCRYYSTRINFFIESQNCEHSHRVARMLCDRWNKTEWMGNNYRCKI